ncbi:MAG: hypothetical protein JWP25_3592 [Bradyrhizobium sp.]|nr:hypothetical protein [Bradyrhizobium sp.]
MADELRKRVARIISPKASFENIEGVHDTQFQKDRRRVAYEKADAVIAILRGSQKASKFSPGEPTEVRKKNGKIDEIIIRSGDVHIEQMSADGWFMGVNASDGSYWQFWFGAANRKSRVEFRHTEMVSAEEESGSAALAESSHD